jgi:hypothetical protein
MADGQSRGCFFYGCLTFILVVLAVLIGVYFGTRKAINLAVTTYTDTKPADLPKIQLSAQERKDLRDRFEKLSDSASHGRPVEEMVLSADEFNALLLASPGLGKLQDQIYFQVETNNLKAQVSLPLDQFQIWRSLGKKMSIPDLRGRYLNGTATLDTSVDNGELQIKVRDMTAKGKPLPSSFMANLQTQNLAEDANKNADARFLFQKIQKLEIRDGKVRIKFKGINTGNSKMI